MENLKKLSEITTRYGTRDINELEFKTPEDFAAYKKKHKIEKYFLYMEVLKHNKERMQERLQKVKLML